MQNPIIVALDVPTLPRALELAEQLAPVVGAFKIGSELFTSVGPEVVRRIRAVGEGCRFQVASDNGSKAWPKRKPQRSARFENSRFRSFLFTSETGYCI